MMNKISLAVALLLFSVLFSACDGGGERVKRLEEDLEEAQSRMSQDSLMMADLRNELETVYDKLDEMREMEQKIRRISSDMRGGDIEAPEGGLSIDQNMEAIQQKLNESKARIRELQSKLKKANREKSAAAELIATLQRTLEDKDGQIKDMQEQILVLQNEVRGWKSQYLSKLDEADSLQMDLSATKDELHTAYYVVGTEADLKKKNIIQNRRRGFEPSRNKGDFTAIDTRDVTTIELGSSSDVKAKKVRLVPERPSGSFKISKSGGQIILEITDAEMFWRDKYLAVLTKTTLI